MQVTCPWCGHRAENEFHWGGPTGLVRPPVTCSDEEWRNYLYNRTNTKGISQERWRHTFGCGQWFNIERDTETHALSANIALAGAPQKVDL